MEKEINFYIREDKYGWMSNFERCIQEVDSIMYPTNEHYYQSQKAKNKPMFWWIADAPSPYMAMIAGRGLRPKDIVEDWEEKKIEVMLKGLRAKFKNPELRKRLLDTGNSIIHEDSPVDLFWGKRGKDMLGKLLMQVREEIRKEKNHG